MPELAVSVQTFCIALDFLQSCFWNWVLLLQDWSNHDRSFVVPWWTRGSLRCIHLLHENWFVQRVMHCIPFLFHLPWIWILMSDLPGIFRKAEDAYPTGAPGPCSQFLVESKLLIYFCNFVYIILFFFYVRCCVCQFFMYCLCSCITFFLFPNESRYPWLH